MEQGQTELKGPAPAQVGCSAESRLKQKEGYGWHAHFYFAKIIFQTDYIDNIVAQVGSSPKILSEQASSYFEKFSLIQVCF